MKQAIDLFIECGNITVPRKDFLKFLMCLHEVASEIDYKVKHKGNKVKITKD